MAKDNFQKFLDDANSFVMLKRKETMESTVEIGKLSGNKRDAQEFYLIGKVSNEIRSGIIKLLDKYFPK